MSLALVDEGSVGEGEGDTSTHIECTCLLVVETRHRTLNFVSPEAQRSVRLSVWREVGREGNIKGCMCIGHPELVVSSHLGNGGL